MRLILRRKKCFFFEKKAPRPGKQKTFVTLGYGLQVGLGLAGGPQMDCRAARRAARKDGESAGATAKTNAPARRSFLLLFFQKKKVLLCFPSAADFR
jgi:hypothetical protein